MSQVLAPRPIPADQQKNKAPSPPKLRLRDLMFLEGQRCFFCHRIIPLEEATIEHLIPKSAGGTDHRDNLVLCCKGLNQLFGDMTVKEKLRVVLNQNGKFTCPQVRAENRIHPLPSSVPVSKAA